MTSWLQTSFFSIVIFLILASCQPDTSALQRPQPEWIADAVFYQILPERFRNGNPENDPTKKSLYGGYSHDTTSSWQMSSWNADWYKLQPWEKENGKGFAYNVQRRRYGGDLQGILQKLDYFHDLGINAIYLNPIFESSSLHKYDATTYLHVDDNFGPNPAKDRQLVADENPINPKTWRWTTADSLVLKLIREAHRRNIRIILDGVFNRVGMTFWASEDVRKNGPKSAFKDWFSIYSWDDPDRQKPMVWDGMVYEPEKANISRVPRPVDSVKFDFDLFAYYRNLIQLRKQEIALRRGDFKILKVDDQRNLFVFSRQFVDKQIIVLMNNSNQSQTLENGILGNGPFEELLTKAEWSNFKKGEIGLQPYSGLVFKKLKTI